MCRPEKPISTSNKALRELQEWLREQRARCGDDYRTLSLRAGCHATTLQRAASGEVAPTWSAVRRYAQACQASTDEAKRLWKTARYEETRLARGRGLAVPRPEFIRDSADLSAALQDLYERAGSPSLRTMEEASQYGVLPRSSLWRIITKQAVPHSLQQFQAYLRACDVPKSNWSMWEAAWTRAWRHEKQEDDSSSAAPYEGGRVQPWIAPLNDVELLVTVANGRGSRRSGSRRVRRGEVRRALTLLDSMQGLLALSAKHSEECEECQHHLVHLHQMDHVGHLSRLPRMRVGATKTG